MTETGEEVNKTHGPPRTVHLLSTRSPELLRPRKGTKCRANLGLDPCGTPKNLNGLDLESAKKKHPLGTLPFESTLEA